MEKSAVYHYSEGNNWSEAWTNPLFRIKAIGGVVLFIAIMISLPHFFTVIEARQGIILNDWLLQRLPARNFSIIIFIFLWSSSILILVRSIQQPAIFLPAIYLFIIITLTRVLTISLVPLEAPAGLIPLKDPLTNLTYGGSQIFMTKDLFFSGHTANLFMIYLCLQKKRDKQFALLSFIIVAMLLLVQHVHYSIDVIMAIAFTWFLVKIAKRLSFLKVSSVGRVKQIPLVSTIEP